MARNPYYVKTCAMQQRRGCAYSLTKRRPPAPRGVHLCEGDLAQNFSEIRQED